MFFIKILSVKVLSGFAIIFSASTLSNPTMTTAPLTSTLSQVHKHVSLSNPTTTAPITPKKSLLLETYNDMLNSGTYGNNLVGKTLNIGRTVISDPRSFLLTTYSVDTNYLTNEQRQNPLAKGINDFFIIDPEEDRVFIDIAHLDNISSKFLTTLDNWMEKNCQGKTIIFRYLFGSPYEVNINTIDSAVQLGAIVTKYGGDLFVGVFNGTIIDESTLSRFESRLPKSLTNALGDKGNVILGGWNHAKIFTVNDIGAITGGENFWNEYYPPYDKVIDTSMYLAGKNVARDAHGFADYLWKHAVDKQSPNSAAYKFNGMKFNEVSEIPTYYYPALKDTSTPVKKNEVRYLSVGKLGAIHLYKTTFWKDTQDLYWLANYLKENGYDKIDGILNELTTVAKRNSVTSELLLNRLYNEYMVDTSLDIKRKRLVDTCRIINERPFPSPHDASVYARNKIISKATKSISISQQKLGLALSDISRDVEGTNFVKEALLTSDGIWPLSFFFSVAEALNKANTTNSKLEVRILTSSHKSKNAYRDSIGIVKSKQVLTNVLGALINDHEKANAIIESSVTFREMFYIDFSNAEVSIKTLNHSKFWMVDNTYAYVGSDNIYPSFLQELGYIIEINPNSIEVKDALIRYYNLYWFNSYDHSWFRAKEG